MKTEQNKARTAVLSASTILILSGFLIGLTVGKIVAEELSPYVLSCGLAGFLAFIALDQTATRRKEDRELLEKNQMEERLTRHVGSLSSAGFVLPPREASPHDVDDIGRVGNELLRELRQEPQTLVETSY